MPPNNYGFYELMDTIKMLRSENGCPWDKKQTTRSLKKYLLEECDEIITAIGNEDADNLCEELGDFLYLILMIGEINGDQDNFGVDQIIRTINEKLVRRHPHVFQTRKQLNESELRRQWAEIKESEKAERKIS